LSCADSDCVAASCARSADVSSLTNSSCTFGTTDESADAQAHHPQQSRCVGSANYGRNCRLKQCGGTLRDIIALQVAQSVMRTECLSALHCDRPDLCVQCLDLQHVRSIVAAQ
jgi:hypothetical protein